MTTTDLPTFIRENYEIHEWRHACAILRQDFAQEYKDICDVLMRFRLNKSHIAVGGGRKSKVSGWLEIEWNNKDPFFDRDLNNFLAKVGRNGETKKLKTSRIILFNIAPSPSRW